MKATCGRRLSAQATCYTSGLRQYFTAGIDRYTWTVIAGELILDDDMNVAGKLSGRVAANLDIAGDLILDTRGLWLRRCRGANRTLRAGTCPMQGSNYDVAGELIVHCFTTFSTTFHSYFWSQTSGAE